MIKKERRITVLVVDDSLFFRETIAKRIAKDSAIEVVGVASNPYEARDKIIALKPKVMVLDVEMPRMNGIEFLKRLMPQYPIPVVLMSGSGSYVFDGLNAGAVDFVSKIDGSQARNMDSLIQELIVKIKIASTAKLGSFKKAGERLVDQGEVTTSKYHLIGIGASTGGTEAIYEILRELPQKIPGIVIVQHMPANFTKMYAQRLNNSCLIHVKEAEEGDEIMPGRALIAPGDQHMRIQKRGNKYYIRLSQEGKVSGHRPSVDVLFDSIAIEAPKTSIGMILTGMGGDGAKGLLKMRNAGARTLGQDEKSCVVYGMPKVAYEYGAVEKQVPLDKMALTLIKWLKE